MFRIAAASVIACVLSVPSVAVAQRTSATAQNPSPAVVPAAALFPEGFDWQHKKPEEVGMDSARLDEAVKQAIASENPASLERCNR